MLVVAILLGWRKMRIKKRKREEKEGVFPVTRLERLGGGFFIDDYMPSGPLSVYLKKDGQSLSWDVRFRIDLGFKSKPVQSIHELPNTLEEDTGSVDVPRRLSSSSTLSFSFSLWKALASLFTDYMMQSDEGATSMELEKVPSESNRVSFASKPNFAPLKAHEMSNGQVQF
ncbi:unnamed protein product [Ilex paraguariensis]|uniref:Uncharacterized protein n=1 Tax=Ilex paraguariensis TaxID=185542 RepID=A0ABC8SNN6_9AQUA